jgi:hypothetical protein
MFLIPRQRVRVTTSLVSSEERAFLANNSNHDMGKKNKYGRATSDEIWEEHWLAVAWLATHAEWGVVPADSSTPPVFYTH